ncbi:MAG: hypothetical protein KAY37_16300 [Phycisphaerae bacterium]|nr:hypothetical protein [Phycisphaerae bacterium]
MKACSTFLAVILLGFAVSQAFSQNAMPPQPRADWLAEMIQSCAPYRATLVAADLRNGKLLGHPTVLADIDEKARFVREADYAATVEAAGRWLEEQFPLLREAFTTHRVESGVNVTTGLVYFRGQATEVYFAATVPIKDVTCCEPEGPWSLTLVHRGGPRWDDDLLRALHRQDEREQVRTLNRYLAQFGKVGVAHVRKVQPQPALLRVEGEGTFRALKLTGALKIVAASPVVYLELSHVNASEMRLRKPFMNEYHAGTERQPDWTGEANVRAIPVAPAVESSKK